MSRGLTHILVMICLALPGWAAEPVRQAPRPLASAFHAMQADRWEVAARLAARDADRAAHVGEARFRGPLMRDGWCGEFAIALRIRPGPG